MTRILILLLLLATPAAAQTPDCSAKATLTATKRHAHELALARDPAKTPAQRETAKKAADARAKKATDACKR